MRERIDIVIDEVDIIDNGKKLKRLENTFNFMETDRIPVIINANQWTALYGRSSSFGEYIRSPKDNMRGQILNYKWKKENIHDDSPINLECITVEPDFGVLRGTEFPMEIAWQEDQPPKCEHILNDPEQIDGLGIPDPWDGINARRIEWYQFMCNLVDDFDVRINGQPVSIKVTLNNPGGPFPSAFALAGSNLFLWMLTDPDRIHKLMDIVTQSHLQCISHFDSILERDPVHPQHMGADAAEMISPELFREFVVPYYLRVWEKYEGRRDLHMCGRIDHLLDIIRDELKVGYLDGFGFCVDYRLLSEKLSGKMVLRGGPDPVLVKHGPVGDIIGKCTDYIEIVGRKGGYILSNGGGAANGTPSGHYEAIMHASEKKGSTFSKECKVL